MNSQRKAGWSVLARFVIVLCLAIATPPPCSADGWAVVVGVNSCPDFELPDGVLPRPLLGAERDAHAAAETIRRSLGVAEDNVTILIGSKATHEAVSRALEKVALQAKAADYVVFSFSGHGTQIADVTPYDEEDDRLDEALCLYDGRTDGENLLLDDQLGRWLDRLNAGSVTVLLDCCHSGTGAKGGDDVVARYLPTTASLARKPAGEDWRDLRSAEKDAHRGRRTAFFACRPSQMSFERRLPGIEAPGRAGQFSHYLWSGMASGKADLDENGRITNQELHDYVSGQLDRHFNSDRGEADQQHPLLEADDPQAAAFQPR